jgi:uncharacterized protein (DUF58 family)
LLLAVALLFDRSDAMAVAAMFILSVVLAWLVVLIWARPGHLSRLTPPEVLAPGETVAITLVPVPGSGWPPPPETVVDATDWGDASPQVVATRGAPGTPPGGFSTALGYAFAAPHRGAFAIGPATVTLNGPLGLVRLRYTTAPAGEVLVGPARFDLAVDLPATDHDRPQPRSKGGVERVTDPSAVRAYQPGDPRRLVHWRATARRDQLMVRETVTRARPDAWVLVDDAAAPSPATETAIAAAATVGLRLLRAGHAVHLVTMSGRAAPKRFDPAAPAAEWLATFARLEVGTGNGRRATSSKSEAKTQPAPASTQDQIDAIISELGPRQATTPMYCLLAEPGPAALRLLAALAPVADPGLVWLGELAEGAGQDSHLHGWEVRNLP